MAESVLTHAGKRIRLYRKACGMTLEQLAQKIHKSKASVSKYEAGVTAVDLLTLHELAGALGVGISALTDYRPAPAGGPAAVSHHAFDRAPQLFLYDFQKKNVQESLIQLGAPDEHGYTATMFYGVDDIEKLEQCLCVYRGHMHSHATVLNYVFLNHYAPAEITLLNFFVPMHKTSVLVGMISGLGRLNMRPTARKVVLSVTPLPLGAQLRDMLTLSPGALKEMKTAHVFEVSADGEGKE